MTAWKLGLKAVAIYRDGSKRTQPLNTGEGQAPRVRQAPAAAALAAVAGVERRLEPPQAARTSANRSRTSSISPATRATSRSACTRTARRARFSSSMSKQGSTISGLMDSFATAISYALQYGVPLQFLVDKFAHMRFEPSGFHQESADSVRQIDRRLPVPLARVEVPRRSRRRQRGRRGRGRGVRRYGTAAAITAAPAAVAEEAAQSQVEQAATSSQAAAGRASSRLRQAFINQADAPPCPDCGCIMVRNGTCYKCMNCGATSGCS